jgi:hypothetical protein
VSWALMAAVGTGTALLTTLLERGTGDGTAAGEGCGAAGDGTTAGDALTAAGEGCALTGGGTTAGNALTTAGESWGRMSLRLLLAPFSGGTSKGESPGKLSSASSDGSLGRLLGLSDGKLSAVEASTPLLSAAESSSGARSF